MEQYIRKSTIVAEIERLIDELVEEGEDTMFEQGRISAFEDVKLFLDSLKVENVENSIVADTLIENAASWIAQYKWNKKMIEDFKNYLKECRDTLTKIK